MLRIVRKTAFVLLLGILLIWSLFPLWYAFVASFSSDTELYVPHYLPPGAYWGNYADLFARSAILHGMLNSALVGFGVIALSLCLGLAAALPLARYAFRGKKPLLMAILATTMFPQASVLAGFFEFFTRVGLNNTLFAVMLSDLLLILPFMVWLLVVYLRALPRELDDMAALDDIPALTVLTRVFVPLLWPGIAASALLSFIAIWNEFLFAFTFTMTVDQRTGPVAVALLWGHTPHDQPWGTLMAACVVMTIPVAALVLLLQRWMVSGLTAGAVGG